MFEFQPGPIFVNILVVDEINRALPKAQSALLEGMAERQVTVDGVTHPLPDPFPLIATENAIEQEGAFPLPEAQLDRFIVRRSLGYPTLEEELAIVDAQLHGHPVDRLRPVVALDELPRVFAADEEVYVDPLLKQWAVELVRATRSVDIVEVGASVRGSLALERVARARALVHGRDYVVAEDIERLFRPVVVHRIVLATEVVLEGATEQGAGQRVAQVRPADRHPSQPGRPPPRPLTVNDRPGSGPVPLVPHPRFSGVRFGPHRSPRRGEGDEVAGIRPYRPGDRRRGSTGGRPPGSPPPAPRTSSSPVSSSRIRRPASSSCRPPTRDAPLPPLPWLDKAAATEGGSSPRRRDGRGAGRPRRGRPGHRARNLARPEPPGVRPAPRRAPRVDAGAGPEAGSRSLGRLTRRPAMLPAGTFVFVVSDFVACRPPAPGRGSARCGST